jgi:hypothetical protein
MDVSFNPFPGGNRKGSVNNFGQITATLPLFLDAYSEAAGYDLGAFREFLARNGLASETRRVN